jgi:hypothetical protein
MVFLELDLYSPNPVKKYGLLVHVISIMVFPALDEKVGARKRNVGWPRNFAEEEEEDPSFFCECSRPESPCLCVLILLVKYRVITSMGTVTLTVCTALGIVTVFGVRVWVSG